jgi:elongator complex protein 1
MTNEYRKAFEILRQQKIDLNLIFDVNPEGFAQKYEEIIKQIEKVDYLNLFLTSLKDELNEDLEYILSPEEIRNNKEGLSKLTQLNTITKTKLICDLMIKGLSKIDRELYILTIMTAHIKINELEIVLNQIIDMKGDEDDDTEVKIPPHLNPESITYQLEEIIFSHEKIQVS